MKLLHFLFGLSKECGLCGRRLRPHHPPQDPHSLIAETSVDPRFAWRIALFCKRCLLCQCRRCAGRHPWVRHGFPTEILWVCGKKGCTGVLTTQEEIARRFVARSRQS